MRIFAYALTLLSSVSYSFANNLGDVKNMYNWLSVALVNPQQINNENCNRFFAKNIQYSENHTVQAGSCQQLVKYLKAFSRNISSDSFSWKQDFNNEGYVMRKYDFSFNTKNHKHIEQHIIAIFSVKNGKISRWDATSQRSLRFG